MRRSVVETKRPRRPNATDLRLLRNTQPNISDPAKVRRPGSPPRAGPVVNRDNARFARRRQLAMRRSLTTTSTRLIS
jgi:hypothetical protein